LIPDIPGASYDYLLALVIFLVAILFSKAIAIYLRRHLRERLEADSREVFIKAFSYVIIGIALLTVLPILGVDPSGLLVAGGILAIVLAFASQSIVGNLVSGVFLMVERPIKIGDSVHIEGVTGYVEDIHLISTTLRTLDGIFVRIPNEKVFTANIINYLANPARRFKYEVGIRYSDDADKAIDIITKLIEDEPLALVNPAPLVFVKELGDNSVNISVRVWSPSTEWWSLCTILLWKIKKGLEAQGIEIPFPQQTLWFANPLEQDVVKGSARAHKKK
jgi:small-conductance mechanosensitive channel